MADISQAIEGYICSCGEKFDNKKDFLVHLVVSSRKDGKGVHSSKGRVNLQTGEITMPNWSARTEEQKKSSTYAKKSSHVVGAGGVPDTTRITNDISAAQEIKFVPRVYTADYTPIMRAAQAAASREWRWLEMSLVDFIDTVFYYYFKEHGIILGGYIVQTPEDGDGHKG